MKRTYKKIISLCAVLVFALALIPTSAFATDPFSAIAVGGLSGASGGGLFSAMAAGSGIDINYGSYPSTDNLDSLWNNLNQDHVYFSGTKGQETIVDPDTGIPTVYDYISVDITDWLQAQSDFIEEFVTTYNVTDNDSGSISEPRQSHGYVFPFSYSGGYYGYAIGNIAYDMTYSLGSYAITFNLVTQGYIQCVITYNGNTYSTSIRDSYLGCPVRFWTNSAVTKVQAIYETSPGAFSWFSAYDGNTTGTGVRTINWYSGTVNTGVYDGYSASKVRIPSSSWSPSDPVNWNVAEFLEELTVKMASGYASDITIENDSPVPPVPPPVPSTPLGDIPSETESLKSCKSS